MCIAFHATVPVAWRSFARTKARTMQTIKELLANNITKANYDQLPTILGMSQNKLSRRLADPSQFTYEDLLKINDLLINGLSSVDLVKTANVGIDKLTVREYRLLKGNGNESVKISTLAKYEGIEVMMSWDNGRLVYSVYNNGQNAEWEADLYDALSKAKVEEKHEGGIVEACRKALFDDI